MTQYEMVDVPATPYLYQERTCGMDLQDIGTNMEDAFGNVYQFTEAKRITAQQVLAVYHTHDSEQMTFQAGVVVSTDDAAKAERAVKAGTLPAGDVLHFTHVGPYPKLRVSYGEMMKYREENDLKLVAPTWEIYVSDPKIVAAEELVTEVYVTLA